MYACLECGRKFKTIAAAERAADRGCPKCGGVDVDLDTRQTFAQKNQAMVERIKMMYPSEVGYIEGR